MRQVVERKQVKRVLCVVSISALLVAGCGAKDSQPQGSEQGSDQQTGQPQQSTSSIDEIEVTGEPGTKAEVKVTTPFSLADPAHKVLEQGTGDKVDAGMQVTANYTLVSGQTGEILESSYDAEKPSGFPMDDTQINKNLYDAMMGAQVGGRVLMATNSGNPPQTLIYVWDIVKVEKLPEVLKKAEGTEKKIPDNLPAVTRDDSGKPSIGKPSGDPPGELTVVPAIEGTGPEVKEGQKVTVHYTGWLWDDTSTPFDSSWDRGEPFSFTPGNGEVIAGWEEGVTGQKVGSQILMVIPADKGYGEAGSPPSIPGGATLIFVVDILAAVG